MEIIIITISPIISSVVFISIETFIVVVKYNFKSKTIEITKPAIFFIFIAKF